MADICETVKVKPWGEGQGEFVEINVCDFDEAIHTLADKPYHDGGKPRAKKATK